MLTNNRFGFFKLKFPNNFVEEHDSDRSYEISENNI